jgi:hypothetical protein
VSSPLAGSQPLLRWTWGPLSVPCRPGTPHTGFKSGQGAGCATMCCHVSCGSGPFLHVKESSNATTCHVASDLTSLPRRALVLPRVLRLRTSPPCQGELRHCHVSCSSGPHLPVKESSDATTCPIVLDPTSPLEKDQVLPHVPRLPVGRGPQARRESSLAQPSI